MKKLFLGTAILIFSATGMEKPKKYQPDPELLEKYLRAAHNNNLAMVKQCLETDINLLNERDKHGETALFIACHCDSIDVAEYLAQQKNIDPNTVSPTALSKRTPLHFVCSAQENAIPPDRKINLISLLLRAGADPNAKDYYNHTPLHELVESPAPQAIELLIDAGAQTNRPLYQKPLLAWHQMCANSDAIRALLKSADITQENVQVALKHNRENRMLRLVTINDIINRQLHNNRISSYVTGLLEKLLLIAKTPPEKLISNASILFYYKTLDDINDDIKIYYAKKFLLPEGIYNFFQTINDLKEIDALQEAHRTLFSYYRTRRLLSTIKQGNKLSRLPPEILRTLPYYAAQKESKYFIK